jgi:hypothetical protein
MDYPRQRMNNGLSRSDENPNQLSPSPTVALALVFPQRTLPQSTVNGSFTQTMR